MKRPRVLLADDHVMLLDALAHVIAAEFDIVGTAHDGWTLVEMAEKHHPDVIVLDISMPNLNGIDAARILKKKVSSAKLVFLTIHGDVPVVEEAFRAGASGYVLKICGAGELVNAIQCVARGATYITPHIAGDLISTLMTAEPQHAEKRNVPTLRQREVLQLLAEGNTMKEVAVRLNISTRTAESHKYEMMRLLGVQTTAELIRYAVQVKLV